MLKWIKNLFAKKPTVYCIFCENFKPDGRHPTNHKYYYTLGKCLAPQNKMSPRAKDKALNFVADGKFKEKIPDSYFVDNAYDHRNYGWISLFGCVCGKKGRWFKPKKEEENES